MPPARIQTSHLREPSEGSAGASRSGHTGSYSGVFGELVEPVTVEHVVTTARRCILVPTVEHDCAADLKLAPRVILNALAAVGADAELLALIDRVNAVVKDVVASDRTGIVGLAHRGAVDGTIQGSSCQANAEAKHCFVF